MYVKEPKEKREIKKVRKGILKTNRKTEKTNVNNSVVKSDILSGVGFLITLQIYSLRL